MRDRHRVIAMLGMVLLGCWPGSRLVHAQDADGEPLRWTSYVAPSDQPRRVGEVQAAARSAETLADAWRVALENDDRIKAGAWRRLCGGPESRSSLCRRRPLVQCRRQRSALSDQIALTSPLGDVPMFGQGSVGFHAIVTQPVYTGGKISSAAAAAGAEVTANRAEVQRTRLDVKMSVAEAYVGVLRGKRVLEVAKSRAASLRAHAHDVDNRYQAEKASRNDVLAVQVALADAQQQELRAANTLEMMKAAYNRALGRDLTEAVDLAELHDDGDPGEVDALIRTAWEHRPEIKELSARAAALRDQASAACSETSPQVTLRGGYLYQGDKYVQPSGVAGVALTAEWNLFDSGRASHKATALSQRAEGLLRLRRDAESAIALEIRQRWLEYQTARQQIAVARVAITQADENLRVVRDRYVQQLGNNTEVLDAETLRVQAYMNWYNSSYEALLVRLRLQRAAGVL